MKAAALSLRPPPAPGQRFELRKPPHRPLRDEEDGAFQPARQRPEGRVPGLGRVDDLRLKTAAQRLAEHRRPLHRVALLAPAARLRAQRPDCLELG